MQAKKKGLTCFDSSIPDFCLSSPHILQAELGIRCIKPRLPMFVSLLTLDFLAEFASPYLFPSQIVIFLCFGFVGHAEW